MFPQAEKAKQTRLNPRQLLIVSQPKVGKTHLALQLPNALFIDLENSTEFYAGQANIFNTQKNYAEYAETEQTPMPYEIYVAKYLHSIVEAAKENGPQYDYIIVDTATALQDIAEVVATLRYKRTPMGKTFKEDTILTMAHGGGYLHLREMFKKLYDQLRPACKECLILLAHPKDSNIVVNGKDLQAVQLNLSGKLAQIVTSKMDAMATMYRKENANINVLNFRTSNKDTISGARVPHLKNKEIEISELKEDGTFVSHWDQIFIK